MKRTADPIGNAGAWRMLGRGHSDAPHHPVDWVIPTVVEARNNTQRDENPRVQLLLHRDQNGGQLLNNHQFTHLSRQLIAGISQEEKATKTAHLQKLSP